MENALFCCYFRVCFNRPLINRKFEEKTCGDGPKLDIMFDDDQNLKGWILEL